ncbi:MAG: hypothetical protein ACLP8B_14645, partial [Xanthobacteraceae bacterium]
MPCQRSSQDRNVLGISADIERQVGGYDNDAGTTKKGCDLDRDIGRKLELVTRSEEHTTEL